MLMLDLMESNYKCFIDIRFSGGDIQFDVSSDKQLFSFKSGIGFVAIPNFFSTLSSLYLYLYLYLYIYIREKSVRQNWIVMETLITIYFPVMV